MQGIFTQLEKRAHLSKAEVIYLSKAAHKWDHTIRHELRQFAGKHWHDEHLLGLAPARCYRLRKQVEPWIYTWWVEHDIPPYDLFRCEAYRVEMTCMELDQPQLVLRSGEATYTVAPVSAKGLADALDRMSKDKPLIIHRQFGPALDP